MNITVYTNLSEPNKLDKTLSVIEQLTGSLRAGCNVVNPVVTVQLSALSMTQVAAINYAYIEEFDRYYFITDITLATNKLWVLNMRVDALSSFKDQIRARDAVISRTEKIQHANLYLADNRLKFEQRASFTTQQFPTAAPDPSSIILSVVGGHEQEVE